METIENLAKQASQLTMYDLKSYYTQAKNMVLSVSEMEAKVREATNDDAWGASSTLMQEIASATNNYAQFNEIMPTIYARFMEKEAREWRQIYKALTLLEYLVKHGSERVVDDARAHVSTIKMLRSFHYIDEKGKDQGINVRNRAQEIAALLGDVERIRTERRKAKANRNKYQGTGNDGLSFSSGSGGRYGGFGSETVGGARVGGGGFAENDDYRPRGSTFRDIAAAPAGSFDEYEGADDFDDDPPPRRTTSASASASSSRGGTSSRPPKPVPKETVKAVEKPKEVNLFDFGDDDEPTPAPVAASAAADDDFDDFQQAPAAVPAKAPVATPRANANLFDLLDSAPAATPAQNRAPSLSMPVQPSPVRQTFTASVPNYGGMTSPSLASVHRPLNSMASPTATTSPKPTGGSSTFDDLFATQLSSLAGGAKLPSNGAAKGNTGAGGKTIKDLEKEKAMSSLWGSGGATGGSGKPPAPSGGSGGFDDLLL